MDSESAQVDDNPLISVNLGDNGGELSFGSIKDAQAWIDQEITEWKSLPSGLHLGGAPRQIVAWQLQLPAEIERALVEARDYEDAGEAVVALRIQHLFDRYAEHGSVYSQSEIGKTIRNFKDSGSGAVALGVLTGALGISAAKIQALPNVNEETLVALLAGRAIGTTFDVVKRSDLPEHQSRMDEQLGALDDLVKQAKHDRTSLTEQGKAANAEVSEYVENQRETWDRFLRHGRDEYEALKRAYEEQLRLQAPAAYWRERAEVTSLAAKRALGFFAMGAIFVAGAVSNFGPDLLARLAEIGAVDSLGTLAVLSIPALAGLWVLRQIARLFVTNLESSADAKMRETMATTYLALTREGTGSVGDKERLMVLEALFRPPAAHKGDDGHFGGALEILTRRNST